MMPQDMPAPAERDVDKALLSLLTRGGHNTRYYACIFYHKKRRITTPFAEKTSLYKHQKFIIIGMQNHKNSFVFTLIFL